MAVDRLGKLIGTWHADASPAPAVVASPPSTNGNGKHAPDTKAITVAGRPQFFSPDYKRFYYLNGTPSSDVDEVGLQTAFAAAAYCYVAVHYRAKRVSEPPLYVAELNDDDSEEWLSDHALAVLLDSPSPDFDMGELLYRTQVALDTTPGALWVKDEARAGGIGRLAFFDGDAFTIQQSNDRIYGRFRVQTANGIRYYDPEQVVYFANPNPYDWHRSLPWVEAALGWLNLSAAARAAVRDILRHAVVPSIVVQADPKWSPTDDEYDRWKASLDAYADLKGKPLGMTGGGSATRLSMSLQEILPSEILNRVESVVAACSGIPAVVLQFLAGMENSPWSQMEEARRMTYEDTIESLWREHERRLTRQLLRAPVKAGGQPIDTDTSHLVRFDTSKIRALQADMERQARIQESVRDIATRNERRAIMGWAPEAWGEDPPAVAASGAGTSDPEEAKTAAKPATAHKARTPDEAWARFDLLTKAQEAAWESSIATQLSADRHAVLSLFDDTVKAGPAPDTKAPPYGPADTEAVNRMIRALAAKLSLDAAWESRVTPLVESTGRTAVRELAAELGIGFDVAIPGLDAYVQREAAWLVTQVTDTTKQAIRDALEAGLKEGESIDQLRKRIEDSGAFARSRAELIARTETTRVTNGAQMDATQNIARELGVAATKTWVATRDSRVRDSHLMMDGETVPIDGTFPNGREAPGEPNCRCTLTYALEEG